MESFFSSLAQSDKRQFLKSSNWFSERNIFWYDAKYLYMARIGLLQGGGGAYHTLLDIKIEHEDHSRDIWATCPSAP